MSMPRGQWHSSLVAECSGYGVASGLLGGSRRRRSFSADEVEVQDRVGLVQLDLYWRSIRRLPGDVQAFMAVVQIDRRFDELAPVHPFRRACEHRDDAEDDSGTRDVKHASRWAAAQQAESDRLSLGCVDTRPCSF